MRPTDSLYSAITRSFEDHVMNRAERGELKQLFEQHPLTNHDKQVLRSALFDFARSQIIEIDGGVVLKWLEEVIKVLMHGEVSSHQNHTEVYFSPGESCRQAIIALIRSAERVLRICVFTITDNAIVAEILAATHRGVEVKVITDDEKQYDHGSDIHLMRSSGITVHCDNSPSHMHHKFAVADSKRVLTGSYNWTHSAARANQENIVLTDERSAIEAFTSEFDHLWETFSS